MALGPVTVFPGPVDPTATVRQTSLAGLFRPADPADWRWLLGEAGVRLHLPFALLVVQCGAVAVAWQQGPGGESRRGPRQGRHWPP